MKALILSDGRVGHENQSKDFCDHLNIKYEILHVTYQNRFLKILSYILDKISLYIQIFNANKISNNFSLIVATGSTTYYPAIYFSKKLHIKAIVTMYPNGYKLKNFYHIFAMAHDTPKQIKNITILPTNITNTIKANIYNPKKQSIGLIIGGENRIFKMNKNDIIETLKSIKNKYKNYEFAITSSPRTPKDIEDAIEKMAFNFKIIYSKDKKNPIGDFLLKCDKVFITQDSTSMISSAVSFGKANVCIIPLLTNKPNSKYQKLANYLVKNDYAYFYGENEKKCKKFDQTQILKKIKL